MKNVPVLVSREESGEYKHTPLPTDGEVPIYMAVF